MKIKFDKKFFTAMGIASVAALGITMVLSLLALISWAIVFVVLMVLFIPISQACVKFYHEEDCLDLSDFWEALTEDEDENTPRSSSIY